MPRYAYEVRSAAGQSEAGILTADDATEASRMLRKDGKTIVSIREQSGAAAGSVPMRRRRVRKDDVIFLSTQLAVMVDTGVPLPEALDSIAVQTDHSGMQAMISDISESVKGGMTLSAALERHPKAFSNLFVALMRASEASGTMGEMLQRACDYMAQERETRKRVAGAMFYPVAMLCFSLAVVVGLLVFVLPRFEKIYAGKGALLPLPTRFLLASSQAIIDYWPFLLGGLAALIGGLWYYFRTPSGQMVRDRLRISVPLIGPMYRKLYMSRSLRTMATMVTTGVNMLDGLVITAEATGNYFYAKIWKDLCERVREGSSLSEELMNCRLMPRTVAQMVAAGEKTGKLGTVMNRVAEFCEDDLKVAVKTITTMIEPIMIIVMGVIVGGIAAALLLPIFTISRVVASPH